jgi:hypothetical protein
MLTYENLVGNQEDWANYITNVENRETPFLGWLEMDKNPVRQVEYSYQAERWRAARENAHIDGNAWNSFTTVGEGRARLRSLIQWFDCTGSISKLSEDVTDIAGIEDQLAREIPKSLKEMRQDMEVAFLEDTDCQTGVAKLTPFKTRGVGEWIKATAQTTHPVDSNFRPASAQIDTTASGSLTENIIKTILQSMQSKTKKRETITGFVGPSLKGKFSDFQLYIPSSVSTQASGTTFNQDGKSKEITRMVDVYHSDWGRLELELNYWLANLTGSATVQAWRGYFLHKAMWKMRWKQKPQVYKPEFKGGSYEFAADCIAMLVCLNPVAEGKYAPTA